MRVILRKLKLSDSKDIYENINDPEVSRWTAAIPYPYPKTLAEKFIRKSWHRENGVVFGIELLENKKIIGVISLTKIRKEHKRAEIGYWLGQKYWGARLMQEAIKEIVDFGFKKLKLHRIYAKVYKENIASQKTLEKYGFKMEGVHKDSCFKQGKYRDILTYAILSYSEKKGS